MRARLGIPSASSFDQIITTKGEVSKQRTKYLYKLAAERVSGRSEETYQNAAMQRGTELESEARAYYELVNDCTVEQVGFCLADGSYAYGCSPDGLIGTNGLLEIKCPSASVHVEYLLEGGLPSVYFQQVQGQLLVTGRKYCEFVSYYPNLKPLIVTVTPDAKFQAALKEQLEAFCSELDKVVERIR